MSASPVRTALFQLLSNDPTLEELAPGGVHAQHAPAGTKPPYVILDKTSGVPSRSFGDAAKNQLWLVKGVCRGGDAEEAEAIDARCNTLLDKAKFSVAGSELLGSEREADVEYPQEDSGETIFHVGALYRIQTLPTP